MSCYCHTCKRSFLPLGIARHRAMHRDKKEYCEITDSLGRTTAWKFGPKKAQNTLGAQS